MKNFVCLFVAFFSLLSCSHYHLEKRVFSIPELDQEIVKEGKDQKKIILASINDFNGQVYGVESLGIQIGGLDLLQGYVSILKESFNDQLVLLKTGHDFLPASSASRQQSIIQRLLTLNFDIYGVSSKEFIPVQALKSSTHLTFINSNIYTIANSELYDQPPFVSHKILERNGVRLGFISIAPPNHGEPLTGYYFEEAVAAVLRARTHLRRNQAEVIVLISHFPSGCHRPDLAKPLECLATGHLDKLIERLPPQSLDVVFTTGQHHAYGRWKDLMVVTSPGNGLYLNTLVLAYDTRNKKLDLAQSTLFPPTLLCQSFFQMTDDCFIGDERRLNELHKDKLKTVPARFFDKAIPTINK